MIYVNVVSNEYIWLVKYSSARARVSALYHLRQEAADR